MAEVKKYNLTTTTTMVNLTEAMVRSYVTNIVKTRSHAHVNEAVNSLMKCGLLTYADKDPRSDAAAETTFKLEEI